MKAPKADEGMNKYKKKIICLCGPAKGVPGTERERICFVEADQWKNSWFLCRVISGPVSAWYQTSVSQLMCCFSMHSGSYTLFHTLSMLDNDSQLLASRPCFEITIDAFLLILSISQSILQEISASELPIKMVTQHPIH